MPRLVFSSREELLKWIKEKVAAEKYDLYITEESEVILSPIKSTKPLNYAYFKTSADPKDLVRAIKENVNGIKVYLLKSFEWATDLAPGIKVITE